MSFSPCFRSFSRLFGLAILGVFSVAVFSASAQEKKPLTLKSTAQSTKPAQTVKSPAPTAKNEIPASAGTSGVKQIDPFRKNDTEKKVEKQPNLFQELLDRKVDLPKKKRAAAKPVKKTTNVDNPFEDAEVDNPFDDGEIPSNPFEEDESFDETDFSDDSAVVSSSNPFAAGDPFADEDRRNQVSAAVGSQAKPKGPTNRAKSQGTVSASEEPLKNPFDE